jgi:hypothetical protein
VVLTPSKVVPLGLRVTEGVYGEGTRVELPSLLVYRKHGRFRGKQRNSFLSRGLSLRQRLRGVRRNEPNQPLHQYISNGTTYSSRAVFFISLFL